MSYYRNIIGKYLSVQIKFKIKIKQLRWLQLQSREIEITQFGYNEIDLSIVRK